MRGLARLLAGVVALTAFTGCPSFDQTAVENQVPVAFAGGDQSVRGGAQVTLSGSGEDGDPQDVLAYAWTQVGGTRVTLSATDAPEVTFEAPEEAGTLVFALTVSDGFDESLPSLTQVAVRFNRAPLADAGPPVSTPNGVSATLDGSGSEDLDGDPLTYAWRVDGGPAASGLTGLLTGAATPYPTFTPDAKGTFTLALVVDDGQEASEAFVVVTATNNGPVATVAGPVEGLNTSELVVTATASDPDGDAVTEWAWVVLEGPPGADRLLAGDTTDTLRFTPLGEGRWTLGVQASDGEAFGPTATVSVRALNNAPVVDAIAPVSAPNLSDIGLLATASDADGDGLTWAWAVTDGPAGGSHQLLGAASASPTFRPQTQGVWTLTATASDEAESGSATVVVTATNNPPTASVKAANLSGLTAGAPTLLDASPSTDPDGDPLIFRWTQVSGATVTFDANETTTAVRTNVTFPDLGTYGLTLAVSDDGGASWSPEVSVAAQVDNLRPVASIGSLAVAAGEWVIPLDGTGSTDPEGAPLSYTWTQTSGPAANLTGATTDTASVTVPVISPFDLPQAMTFSLVVSDGRASSAPAVATVRIAPSGTDAVFVSPTGDDAATGQLATPVATVDAAVALATAGTLRRMVVMAEGTYAGGQSLGDGVHVVGGFSADFGYRDPALHPSVIDATGGTFALRAVGLTTQTILDGLTILGPSDYTSGAGTPTALNVSDSHLLIRNSVLDGNGAQGTDGGALWVSSTSRPLEVRRSYLRNTRSQDAPAAVRIKSASVSTPILFEGNIFEMDPGAANVDGDSLHTLVLLSAESVSALEVRANEFRMAGGSSTTHRNCYAIELSGTSAVVENNLFLQSNACINAAAVVATNNNVTVQFNTFSYQDPGDGGSTSTALAAYGGVSFRVFNNVVVGWDRFVYHGQTGQTHAVHNNVAFGVTHYSQSATNSSCVDASVDGTCVDPCGRSWTGCWLAADLATVFADAGAADYRPAGGGLLVDRGLVDSVNFPFVTPPSEDHDGQPRPVDDPNTTDVNGTAYDVGAYERQP